MSLIKVKNQSRRTGTLKGRKKKAEVSGFSSNPMKIRAKKPITYHGRTGKPVVHRDKRGRKYIMVRAKGGGTKRLYEGSKYSVNGRAERLRL